ncbi:uncharacterized protein LOC111456585 isoform X2 [Cucurbita moschata]|uniref:Uncharacterized protein LOC111456585 isoform X2 n=1 Tax=Cucurbita moschata TaxID=3662 RepID=A0A6J1GSJ6_CUCMO|nr:uncharacterized protein LOC111456585 isoform X2 [Cucurbita moschata]
MKRDLKPSISTDSNCRKRIKVGDLDCARPLTCRRDTSPVSLKGHVTCPNNAKTSEFAFFKKFKEDANRRFSSSLQRQKELQPKKFNSTDHFRERARHVENRREDFTSHPFVENVTPINFNSMHLPLGNSSKISEVDVKHAHKTFKDIQSKQRNVENDDIFSRKRQKLRQFIQNMSFHGTGESYEKRSESSLFYLLSRRLSGSDYGVFWNLSRYGVISTLLSRLIPESNQYKNEPDSRQFNNNLEKLQWLPGRCWPRLDYEHRLNNSSSPCRLNKSRGRVLFHSDFSTNNDDDNFHVKYRTKEFDSDVEGKMTLLDANSSPSTAAVENYRPLISTLFNQQYGFYDQGEPLHIRKQEMEPLLLGWDTDDIKDDSSKFTEFHTFAEPPISFADDHQPNLHESFGAVALCSSPFPSSNHRDLYSLPYSSLASYQIHGLSRPNVEKEEGIDATLNNVHLNFSSVPKCLSQCDNYVDDRGICGFFCAQSANWHMNYALDDEHRYPSLDSMCASGFVFDFGWKYLSGSKEHCQTAYHLLEYPLDEMRPTSPVNEECNIDSSEYGQPFFIQPESFFQEGKVRSLLTDKLSWDVTRSEINVAITEMDYV